MGRKGKLYNKAKTSPTNFKFKELCSLAESVGFVFRNQTGSHKIYRHPIHKLTLNFQPDKRDKSKAKRFQISQLINIIDELKLIKGGK